MNKLFELAIKISSSWSLAAFAIVALVLLVVKLKGRKVTSVGWVAAVAIVVIALTPMLAALYLDAYGIYRIRIIVLDDHHLPVDHVKVKCSAPGELTQARDSWEYDVPARSKPRDGKIQIYAVSPEDFMAGYVELELKEDYYPATTIILARDRSAKIMGIVLDGADNSPLEGVLVSVVGYESEAQLSGKAGNFSLPAHKANGEPVPLSASKETYYTVFESHLAGDFPVTIRLRRSGTIYH